MKSRQVLATLLVVLFVASVAWAKPIQIPRQPDYHNGKIVFSYLGDLWMVNEDGANPRRLTVHTARDIFPRFSPDGRWIAFSSNRFGNLDVFVMPAQGGEAKQLTFNSSSDSVVGWSRDSKRVIFSSARGLLYPGTPSLYEVSVDGGLERPLPTDWGYWASYSPDGKKLAFNRHPMVSWRKHYRGSYSADLWVMDVERKTSKKILDADLADNLKPNNFWPMYGNGEIYFVSDREISAKAGTPEAFKSTNNIWKIPENGGRPVQVTRHKSGSLFFPSMSADGKVIVYEENFGLWKLDTSSGHATEVKIDIASDEKDNNFEVRTFNNQADSYDLSPTTRRAAISIHGEIFTIATDRGDISRLTRSYWRDDSPTWSPDGKWIAFVTDQSGREELWLMDEEGKNARKISDSDSEKNAIVWAPDSKSLAYTASDHKLYLFTLEGNLTKVLATNEASNIAGPEFSPDGKWISFSKAAGDFRPHIFVLSLADGKERRLFGDEFYGSTGARWTHDGKKIIFLAPSTAAGPAAAATAGPGGGQPNAFWSVALTQEEKDPLSRDIDSEAEAVAAERAGQDRAPRPGGGQQAAPPEVKLDFVGMDRRARQLTRLQDTVGGLVVSADSRTYAFVSGGSIYAIQADGEGMRRLTQPPTPGGAGEGGPPGVGFGFGGGVSSLQFSRDGRTLYYRQGNGIWAIGVGGAAPAGAAAPAAPAAAEAPRGGGRRLTFVARVEVDNREERKQVFHEAWRVMKFRFYDVNMHGVEWAAMRKRYEPLLADVGDREELQAIVSQMIGELNASHTGISGGGGPEPAAMQTRYPGFEMEPDSSGYYKVTHVYKDGPADRDFVKIKVGDFILAVNEEPLKAGDNYWKLYNLAPGRKFEFTVNSKPSLDGAWTSKIEPIGGGAYGTLQYEKWVEDRRQMVDKLSSGDIGYLHIRSMNQPSLRQFERDMNALRFKKAIIIDQRFNPGGNIDQELLEFLGQGQYQYTRSRDSVYQTRPSRGYFGPIVVMQNERSTSDAEVFPDGIRTLKLGTVVGITTYGAVIGTGSYTLLDGSAIRTPGSGLWSVTGQNLENYGVPPDVYVDNTPEDFLKGRDAQLEKAVEVLKDAIRKAGPSKIPGR